MIRYERGDFSVITPTLNAAKYIRDCIKSVKSQNHVKVKHVIVDGGSTDETCMIINEFSHLDVYNLPANGIYSALNYGVEVSESEFICFLNSDDLYVDNSTLFKVKNVFVATGADVVLSGCRFVNEKKQSLYELFPPDQAKSFVSRTRMFICSHPSIFFRRSIFDTVGLYDAKFQCCGDIEHLLRVLNLGAVKIAKLNDSTSLFRLHSDNFSNSKKVEREELRTIARLYSPAGSPVLSWLFILLFKLVNWKYVLYKIKKLLKKC